ncbi:MAG: hypothetical protein M0T77_08955 [Actinomycetota bacterium]|nr:hypothetical protein [Actinomycetota bacterium]
MTASKVSISLDPVVAERARADIAAGRAKSLSAWLNDAARVRLEREELRDVMAAILEGTGGPLTPQELVAARRRLAAAESR